MTKENIIEKIQKLLALADESRGGTEAERELATKRAHELMLKHNIDSFSVSDQSAPGAVGDDEMVFKGALNLWKGPLYSSVGAACFVDTVYWKLGKHETKWLLIGRSDNLAFVRTLCEHLIPWLEDECRTAVREAKEDYESAGHKLNPRAFKRSFMQAATSQIYLRLVAQRSASGVGSELVVHEGAANKEFLEKRVGPVRKSRNRGSRNAAGHQAGREAGDRADLSPGRKLHA
jgi:hypothetical protein